MASGILYVPKKDGTVRMCVDYRYVNGLTIKDSYPLPLIEELQYIAGNAVVYTALDV